MCRLRCSIRRHQKRGDLDETRTVTVIESLLETVVDDHLQDYLPGALVDGGAHRIELLVERRTEAFEFGRRSHTHTHAQRAAPDGSQRPLVTRQVTGELDVQYQLGRIVEHPQVVRVDLRLLHRIRRVYRRVDPRCGVVRLRLR